MKGVILAGGNGTRLYPCTLVVNKHLLPIYDQPMIYYPIHTLVQAGCTEILIVTGGKNSSGFMQLLGNGDSFGIKSILYTYQKNPTGGIADALRLAKSFTGTEKFCMMLGDNLLLEDISDHIKTFKRDPFGTAKIFIKKVDDPTSFGVAEIQNGIITNIIEKPDKPQSQYAVTGLYMYDYTVYDIIDTITPSARGELEITDVNRVYLQQKKLTHAILNSEWLDTGTFNALYNATCIIAKLKGVDVKVN